MSEQNQSNSSLQQNKNRRPKDKVAVAPERAEVEPGLAYQAPDSLGSRADNGRHPVQPALLYGPNGVFGGGAVETQVARLHDPRLSMVQRQTLAAKIGRVQGNGHLAALIQRNEEAEGQNTPQNSTNTGGNGPGSIQHATEQPYDVTGTTLDEVSGQLNHFDGFGAESNTPLGLSTSQVTPQRQEDGSYRVEVEWAINNATVGLPRWTGYNNACPAAKSEWDRFMRQTRTHEQQAHINAARSFVSGLEAADKVITGASVAELQQNLQAKQQELAGRLQTIHDGCDHGASIDAILHPDNGRCDDEEE